MAAHAGVIAWEIETGKVAMTNVLWDTGPSAAL
jgi:hypothetical protein